MRHRMISLRCQVWEWGSSTWELCCSGCHLNWITCLAARMMCMRTSMSLGWSFLHNTCKGKHQRGIAHDRCSGPDWRSFNSRWAVEPKCFYPLALTVNGVDNNRHIYWNIYYSYVLKYSFYLNRYRWWIIALQYILLIIYSVFICLKIQTPFIHKDWNIPCSFI